MDLDALYEDWSNRDATIRQTLRISAQTVAPTATMQEAAFKAGAVEGAVAERTACAGIAREQPCTWTLGAKP